MRKFYHYYFILFFLFSCSKWDKPEQIPAYIYIDKIDLSVTPTQGTASHGIIDAWVYVNDQPVGVFDLPCTVPVLAEGSPKITIAPGIKNDGLTESRAKYSLLQNFTTTSLTLIPGKIVNMDGVNQPVVTYYPSTDIEIWNENFDNASIDFVSDPNSEAGVTFIGDSTIAFEGQGMGEIELVSGLTYARVITSQSFNLPKFGKTVYVEMNYNTNNTMAVGIQAITGVDFTNLDNTVIKASGGEWKKIYVKLTDLVSQQVNATSFKFIITITKDSDVTTVQNYIDNFKVVYDK